MPFSVRHLDMLCDLGELHSVLSGSQDINAYLQAIVELVASHMHVDVCSIYLFDDKDQCLHLAASCGLASGSVGKIKIAIGEGLVGQAMLDREPVREGRASEHPNFLPFPESGEEHYDAFLAIPIYRGPSRIGVLVAQRHHTEPFDTDDLKAMRATGSQLAGAVENARAMVALHPAHSSVADEPEDAPASERLSAEIASEGFARGPSYAMRRDPWRKLFERARIAQPTLEDLQRAIVTTNKQLEAMQMRVEEQLSELASLIFEAQILMLKDPQFIGDVTRRMENEGIDAVQALKAVATHYIEILQDSRNSYMREKSKDVEDLSVRLLHNLVAELGGAEAGVAESVVFASDLYPSDVLKLSSENVAGVVLTAGGVLSHIAILARSLGVTMLIVDQPSLLDIPAQTSVLLDGRAGALYINPVAEVSETLEKRERDLQAIEQHSLDPETRTADGVRVKLLANVNLTSDLRSDVALQLEGVGLYRTEFPFLVRANFPSEEEQIRVYKSLLEPMEGKPVTFRTLDVGGDKCLAYHDHGSEPNPNLGMRSIRFSFRHPEIFHQQIRAILRAGCETEKLRIMFPMISSLDEFIAGREAVRACIKSLEDEGLSHHPAPDLGIMVEIPSVVWIIDELAECVDFLCIGTNDFVQFMLAVDRSNAMVAPYYIPHHPAVLRALKLIADAGIKHGKEVSICGELAHEIEYIPFLIGIGIHTLSVDPRFAVRSQQFVQTLRVNEARDLAERALCVGTVREVEEVLGVTATTTHPIQGLDSPETGQ